MNSDFAQTGDNLAKRFIEAARLYSRRRCISDSQGNSLNYSKTLTAATALKHKLQPMLADQKHVGILLPPSVAAALANIALTMLGKVTVNLNYSSAPAVMASTIEQSSIETVVTSKRFLKRIDVPEKMPELIILEDIKNQIGLFDKLKAWLYAKMTPADVLAGTGLSKDSDMATVIFSSGSETAPKGIMLSHTNILSDIDAMVSIFRLKKNDNLCGVLPFFHSFGFTCSLWLPIIYGVSASYVPNPLDCTTVEKTARDNTSTILFAPPSFLSSYSRRIKPEAFKHLRLVIAGAEKMKTPLADAFEKRFGIRPLEGYGATELSPVVALNMLDELCNKGVSHGLKEGSVGKAIPGIEVKIVQPESEKILSPDTEGVLMVKGPVVMLGYLNKPKLTSQVINDGWYNTGDIAKIDEEGFITITDRLSRFSKIGGEMVPHFGVEETYYKELDIHDKAIAVTGVPNEKKGEELVVLHTDQAGDADKLHDIISKSSVPNLWKPRRNNYFHIPEIPLLGSGKMNIKKIKQIAKEKKDRKSRETNSS